MYGKDEGDRWRWHNETVRTYAAAAVAVLGIGGGLGLTIAGYPVEGGIPAVAGGLALLVFALRVRSAWWP